MNIALWLLQVPLAIAFGMSGTIKIHQPWHKLAAQEGWIEDFAPATVKAIGVLEVLGAIGLILPRLTGILPWLTPLAALGLALTMLGAMATHLRRNEYPMLVPNLVLLVLSAVVAYGRFAL